jgi:hypothetical protein
MKWIKSAVVGAVGSLVMFAIMKPLIGAGVAPFQVPPSAAALKTFGLPMKPLALVAHFGYGIFWSVVLVALFKESTNVLKGLGLAGVLWLGMMLVHSPMIGWGVFGTADTSGLPEVLQLGSTMKYVVSTFLLHVVYGLVIGILNPLWIDFEGSR